MCILYGTVDTIQAKSLGRKLAPCRKLAPHIAMAGCACVAMQSLSTLDAYQLPTLPYVSTYPSGYLCMHPQCPCPAALERPSSHAHFSHFHPAGVTIPYALLISFGLIAAVSPPHPHHTLLTQMYYPPLHVPSQHIRRATHTHPPACIFPL